MKISAELVAACRQARHITVLTGAGVSAESGIPTFREAQTGLWARYDAQDLATPEAFRRHPDLVWQWYQSRRVKLAAARPNPGHLALARLQSLTPKLTLITQNIDGLHQEAGSTQLLELHGNIRRNRCFDCRRPGREATAADRHPPRCLHCSGLLRPDVVWFGESLSYENLSAALEAAAGGDIFLSIGTSALVQPAASLPLEALNAGRTVVEINPQPTPLTPLVDYHLAGPSGEVLPALLKQVWAVEIVDPRTTP